VEGLVLLSATSAITSESVPSGWIRQAFPWRSDSQNEIKATVAVLLHFKSRRLSLA